MSKRRPPLALARPRAEVPADLAAYQDAWSGALDAILAQWDSISAEWQALIVEAVRNAGTVQELAAILNGIIDSGPAAEVLSAAMASLSELAARQVADDAQANGLNLGPVSVNADDLAAMAGLVMRGLAQEWTLSGVREAWRNRGSFTTPDQIAERVQGHLATLTQARPAQAFGAALTAAQHGGRVATMAAAGRHIEYWEATEVLDTNTCSPCRGIDGKRFYTLGEVDRYYPVAGYLGCDGLSRCRGTVVAHWQAEVPGEFERLNPAAKGETVPKPARRFARPLARAAADTSWYRITNNAGTRQAEVAIFDEIGWLGVSAEEFVAEIKALDVDQITVQINSPGGDVFDGLAIYQSLIDHPAKVVTRAVSLAASAASFILQAGDERLIAPHATVMIHNAMGLAVGTAVDMRETADLLDKASANIASIYAEASGRPVAEFVEAMNAETWYSADEAVSAGLVDRIDGRVKGVAPSGAAEDDPAPAENDPVPSAEDDTTAPENRWDLSVFQHAGRNRAPAPKIPPRVLLDVDAITKALRGEA